MWELRWILLGMGAVLIAGLYLWSRKPFNLSFRSTSGERERTEPSISDSDSSDFAADEVASVQSSTRDTDKVVALRLMARGHGELNCETIVLALRNAGMAHGKYGIFHYTAGEGSEETIFSIASLTEPGSFDMANLSESTIPGMTVFMVLPGPSDPVACFDMMVQTARELSQELNAELFDERGSSWSIQRERYIREEIIEYRHQLNRA